MPDETHPFEGVVVLGVSRTGTTLVRRLLDAHPRIAAPAETCVLSAAARFLHSQTLDSGAEFGVLSGLRMAGFEAAEVHGRVRELAFGFHRDYARARGKALWASKTATDVFHLDAIEALCGDHVRYVCLVRHGLDVVCSLEELVARTGGYFEELHAFVRQEHRPRVALGRAWAHATEAVLDLAARRLAQTLVVRYEDLVTAPDATLDALAAFLEVESPAGWVTAALGPPSSAGFGDWKTWQTTALHTESIGRHASMDAATRSSVLEAIAPTMARAGYDPGDPVLDREARQRRAELAMRVAVLRARR